MQPVFLNIHQICACQLIEKKGWSFNLWFDSAWVYSYNFAGSLGVARLYGHEIRPLEPEQAPPWAGNLRREASDI